MLKKTREERVHTLWLYLYETQENPVTESTVVTESRSVVAWQVGGESGEGEKGGIAKGLKEMFVDNDTFNLTVLDCANGFTCVYICQNLPNCTL